LKAESDSVSTETVVDYLAGEVEKVQTQHRGMQPSLSKLDILILAAMNIAHDNVALKKEKSVLLKDVSDRSAGIIERLDRCLSRQSG